MLTVDAHHHFWNLTEVEYPWLNDTYGKLYANYECDQLAADLRVAGVDKTILVQSANSYEDTAYMLKESDHTDWIGAVVGWVNILDRSEADKRLKIYTKHPKFRAVRHMLSVEINPNWLVNQAVVDGLKVVQDHGLIFEVSAVWPDHLVDIPALARQLPDLRFVIDHLGSPQIKERNLTQWYNQMTEAASFPNVYAKISGLNTADDWETWSAETLKPVIDHAIEVFGPNRLMWGSNWPVCMLAGTYQQVYVETMDALADRTKGEIEAIMGGTAEKLYKL